MQTDLSAIFEYKWHLRFLAPAAEVINIMHVARIFVGQLFLKFEKMLFGLKGRSSNEGMAHFVALSSTCMWYAMFFLSTFHFWCAGSFHRSFFFHFFFAQRGFPLVMGNALLPHQCYTLQDISPLLHVHSC